MDDNDFRQVRTLADELGIILLLEVCSDKAFFLVCIKLGVVVHNLCNLDRLESGKLSLAWIILSVLLLKVLEVVDCEISKVIQMILNLLHFCLDALQLLIDCLCIELGNLSYRLLYESVDVLHSDRPVEHFLEFEHSCIDLFQLFFPALCISFKNLVDLVLEEYLFKRTVVPFVAEFVQTDLKLLTEQLLCMVRTIDEYVIYTEELWLVVDNHACVRGD